MLSKERSKVKMQSVAPRYRAQPGLQLPESAQVLIQCYRHSFGVFFAPMLCSVFKWVRGSQNMAISS